VRRGYYTLVRRITEHAKEKEEEIPSKKPSPGNRSRGAEGVKRVQLPAEGGKRGQKKRKEGPRGIKSTGPMPKKTTMWRGAGVINGNQGGIKRPLQDGQIKRNSEAKIRHSLFVVDQDLKWGDKKSADLLRGKGPMDN